MDIYLGLAGDAEDDVVIKRILWLVERLGHNATLWPGRPPVSQLHISGQGVHEVQTDTVRVKMTRDSLLQRQCVAAV